MTKDNPLFWRWEKVAIENELTIRATSFFDRERDVVVIKPKEREDGDDYNYVFSQGELLTDQLNAEWDNELILSKRLVGCFADLQARDVTIRPVEIHLDETIDRDSWVHISVVGRVLGINYQESNLTVDEFGRNIRSIEKLVLNDENIQRSGMHIFRLYDFEQWIVVSDELKQTLEALTIRGMRFLPIDQKTSFGLLKKWF